MRPHRALPGWVATDGTGVGSRKEGWTVTMKRVPELDAIRGVAGLTILFYHFRDRWPWKPWAAFDLYGWSAVDLFFVLSGFLITSIIIRNHDQRGFFAMFYVRRGLRIWPIYYLALFGLVAVSPFLTEPLRLDALPYYLTYTQKVQSYIGLPDPPFTDLYGHTWTLAIEEQFYLFWPALVMLSGRKRLVTVCAVVALLSAAVRTPVLGKLAALAHVGLPVDRVSQYVLLGRCDGFALGGLLAALADDRERLRARVGRFRLGFLLAALVGVGYLGWGVTVVRQLTLTHLAINLTFFGVLGLVVCSTGRPETGWLRLRWLCFCGLISYGLYLYHPLVRAAMEWAEARWGGSNSTAWTVAMIVSSFATAVVSWFLIERPILSLKDRFEYRRDPVVVGPPDESGAVLAAATGLDEVPPPVRL